MCTFLIFVTRNFVFFARLLNFLKKFTFRDFLFIFHYLCCCNQAVEDMHIYLTKLDRLQLRTSTTSSSSDSIKV